MAKKGQKFQQYTEAFKQRMLEKYRSGIPASVLSKEYGVPENTIKMWEYKSYHPAASHKRGRPKGKINYKERYEILKKFQAFLKEQCVTK